MEEEIAFLKEAAAYFAKQPKYAMMKAHGSEFRTRLMCKVLEVSPSGY